MSVSQRLREYLDAQGAKYVVITHSPAFTAQEIAQSLHVPGRELAKTVVVRHGGTLALAVLPAQARVNLPRLGSLLEGEVTLADEKDFSSTFPDCEVGAMPPFGNLYGLRTLVDESLSHDKEIVFSAGTHTDAIRMSFADYRRLVEPMVLWFAEHPTRTGA